MDVNTLPRLAGHSGEKSIPHPDGGRNPEVGPGKSFHQIYLGWRSLSTFKQAGRRAVCDTLARREMTDLKQPTETEIDRSACGSSVPWSISDAMMGFAIVACGGLASLLALGLFPNSWEDRPGPATTFVLLILQILMLGTVWLLAVRKRGARWSSLGFGTRGLRWPAIGGWAFLALVLSLIAGLAYQGIVTVLGLEALEPSPLPDRLLGNGVARVFTVGSLVVLGPAAEEVFFRGFLLTAFVQGIGTVPGTIAASAVFAAAHGDVTVLLPTFASGAILSWLYLRTRSIWPSFLAHSAQNCIAVTFVI